MAARVVDHDQRQPRHYPLDIPHLPFNRYDHRRLTARDIMIHRLMAEFMSPSEDSIMLQKYSKPKPADSTEIMCLTHKMLIDLELLERMLFTRSQPRLPAGRDHRDTLVYAPPNKRHTFGDHFLDLAARHYFEVDSIAMRSWITRAALPRMLEGPVPPRPRLPANSRRREQIGFKKKVEMYRRLEGLTWHDRHWRHLSGLRPTVNTQDRLPLYDGGACLPTMRQTTEAYQSAAHGTKHGLSPPFRLLDFGFPEISSLPSWPERDASPRYILMPEWQDYIITEHRLELFWDQSPVDLCLRVGRGRARDGIWATGRTARRTAGDQLLSEGDPESRHMRSRRRCTSEPPPASFAAALFPPPAHMYREPRLQMLTPRMTLSQLEGRSRRRSLSRTRIREMFDWDTQLEPSLGPTPPLLGSTHPPCTNCAQPWHRTSACRSPCGHCGAPNPNLIPPPPAGQPPTPYAHQHPHLAPQCPVARHNRCKCIAFPTFHAARDCGIPCRRACGSTTAAGAGAGALQHRNAMTCRARCCMCGLRGHSGRECRLRRCRCGAAHLGQDCAWKVACRVPGCDRFLCGLHCRRCGRAGRPFVRGSCWRCEGLGGPVTWAEGRAKRRGRRRKGEGEGEGDGGEVGGEVDPPAEETERVGTVAAVVELPPPAVAPTPIDKEVAEPEREYPGGCRTIFGDPRVRNSTRTNR